MPVIYLNREGKRITRDEFKARRADPEYCMVRQFDNGRVRAQLEWIGRIQNPDSTFPDYYKLFELHIHNYDSEGQLQKDFASGETFSNEAAAIARYEEFLTKWAECVVNDFGKFEEVGNVLTPPPPPDPDAPSTEPDAPELGGVGAW